MTTNRTNCPSYLSEVKVVFLTLLVFSFALPANSQNKSIAGYYVTNSGDTLRGIVNVQDRSFQTATFQKESSSTALTVANAQAFGQDGISSFERAKVASDGGDSVQVFLKVLVRGKLSLLSFQNRLFVKKTAEGKIADITKREIEVETPSGKVTKQDYSGLTRLKLLTTDCPALGSQLDEEYRTRPDYVEIVKRYNECMNTASVLPPRIKVPPHIVFELLLSAVSTSKTLAHHDVTDYNQKLPVSFGLYAGISASIANPGKKNGFSGVVELTLGGYDAQKTFFFEGSGVSGQPAGTRDLSIKATYLRLPIMARYSMGALFFDFGICPVIPVSESVQFRVTPPNLIQPTPIDLTMQGHLVIGAGGKIDFGAHAVRTSLRYYYGFGDEVLPSRSLEVLLGYTLTRKK